MTVYVQSIARPCTSHYEFLLLLLILFVIFTDSARFDGTCPKGCLKKWIQRPFLTSIINDLISGDTSRAKIGLGTQLRNRGVLGPVFLGLERSLSTSIAKRTIHSIKSHRDTRHYNKNLPSPVESVQLSRGGGQLKVKKAKSREKSNKVESILSASDCFVPLKDIAELTLKDVGSVFDYAVKSTQDNFDEGLFIGGKSSEVKPVVEAMKKATSMARGSNVKPALTGAKGNVPGDIETFNFCAAMRILAEWRILRQVPDGNQLKQYATGMNLARKDVVQNIAKIEHAAATLMDHQRGEKNFNAEKTSPTLRDILQFEKDSGIHRTLPKLKDGTGSMGILWNRRGLSFHVDSFEKIMQVPEKFPNAKAAVMAAYNDVFGGYHGWAVKKIFTYSFQEAPEIEEVYKSMNPRRFQEVMETASHAGPNVPKHKQRLANSGNAINRISCEISKIVDSAGQCGPRLVDRYGLLQKKEQSSGKVDYDRGLTGGELQQYISDEMKKEAHEHINSYVQTTKPILSSLADLFEEFNMDDPTKV